MKILEHPKLNSVTYTSTQNYLLTHHFINGLISTFSYSKMCLEKLTSIHKLQTHEIKRIRTKSNQKQGLGHPTEPGERKRENA